MERIEKFIYKILAAYSRWYIKVFKNGKAKPREWRIIQELDKKA